MLRLGQLVTALRDPSAGAARRARAVAEWSALGLRTVEGVPLGVLEGLGAARDQPPLSHLIADGFLTLLGSRIVATEKGRPLLDAVLRALLT